MQILSGSFPVCACRNVWLSGLLGFLMLQVSFLAVSGQGVNDLTLKDYRPVSIYNIPRSRIERAKYPLIDMHAHDAHADDTLVDAWVKAMDKAGVEKSEILSCSTGKEFDSVMAKFARYKDRFDVWCGFDFTGLDQPGWQEHALKELERCHQQGAKGVGELGDKGLGEFYSRPTPGWGVHIDDPRMGPLLEKCAELHMPVSIHVAEDLWMYLPVDSTNDGLMNAATWRVDLSKKGILHHDQLIATLEHAARDHPRTIFLACHLANCCSDLQVLGKLLDKYPNLYADIAARFGEISPIPRFVHAFMEKYAGRLVYGTDLETSTFASKQGNSGAISSYGEQMYQASFRILESADEHFYLDFFGYHWPLYGLALSDATLRKIYGENARKILKY